MSRQACAFLVLAFLLGGMPPAGRPLVAGEIVGREMGCSFCGHQNVYPYHELNCRYYGLGIEKAPTGSSSVPTAGAPSEEAMVQAAGQLGQLMGQAIANMARASQQHTSVPAWTGPAPGSQARAARQAMERSAEDAVLFKEMQDRILKALRTTGATDIPAGLEGEDDGLRPRGTAIFGIGGGDGGDPNAHNDPRVVDLRHLKKASYLIQVADLSGPMDTSLLMDQAFVAAGTDASFVSEGAPAGISQGAADALPAFQRQNAEYRKAHDSNLVLTGKLQEARKRREAADLEVGRRSEELKRAMDAKMDKATLDEKHRMLAEVLAAKRKEDDAFLRARAEASSAAARERFERAMTLAVVRQASVPSPALPSDALRKEREHNRPTLEDRLNHHHPVVEKLRSWIDKGQEERLAKAYGFVDDPARQAALERTVDRLRKASEYPDDEIRVRILDLPKDPDREGGYERNVVASGNTVYVGREYLERRPPPTDEELTFVIGHEIGHIHKDHAVQSLGPAILEAGRSAADDIEPGSGLTERERKWMESQASKARGMGDFTKPQELEADRYGASLALAAGAKPGGMRQACTWMQGQEAAHRARRPGAGERKLDELTRDHPEPEERFEILRGIYGPALGPPLR